jgi:nucleoside-diphosphate-sugar epimerase
VLRTVVITGARGYIGRALAKSLASQGRALRLVSRSAVAPSGDETGAAIEHVQADLRDEESWRMLLQGAEAVVHLSSRTDLRAAEGDPAGDRDLNVEPVRALVRAAERCGVVVPVIFASSTTIVGNVHVNPVNEETPDRPCSVYDRHKLECEIMLGDATRRGVLRACSLRLATVYGYGVGLDSTNPNRGILNAVMQGAARGQSPTIYGDGKYIRDYIFVGDAVDAFCQALSSDRVRNGNHFVIATGRGYTLAEAFRFVAQEAYRATGRKVEVRHVPEPPDLHPIQKRNFIGDSRTFQEKTGWRPRVDLEAGIRDYFQRLLAGSQAAGVT